MDNPNTIFNILSLFLAIVSLGAIVLSIIAYKQSIKTTLMVNSKEHEMSENLKYELIELIAILRAIDQKAASDVYRDKIDFSPEIERLKKIQTSPGFMIYLKTIADNDRKSTDKVSVWFEHIIALLADQLLASASTEKDDIETIRLIIHDIIEILENHTDFQGRLGTEFENSLRELCAIKGVYSDFDYDNVNQKTEEKWKLNVFFEYLKNNEKIEDPDVLLWIGKTKYLRFERDPIVKQALHEGATSDITLEKIIERYQRQYDIFMNKVFNRAIKE